MGSGEPVLMWTKWVASMGADCVYQYDSTRVQFRQPPGPDSWGTALGGAPKLAEAARRGRRMVRSPGPAETLMMQTHRRRWLVIAMLAAAGAGAEPIDEDLALA